MLKELRLKQKKEKEERKLEMKNLKLGLISKMKKETNN